MTIQFKVKPLYVKEGSIRLGRWILRRFQEKVLDAINRGKDAILMAPTGSGKTLSLLLGDSGFVGVYPNNTLLLDQQRSIHKILTEALNAKLVYKHRMEKSVDILRVYELNNNDKLPIAGSWRVAVALLSGRYIGYEYDDNGRLIPKRVSILRNIVDKICYPSKGETPYYIITLATPDTALMIMSGIYRDFEKVGFTLHDFLLSTLEEYGDIDYLLSKYKVSTIGELGDIGEIRQCLLKHPWFIDEFHLYGTYETYSILPTLKVYREYAGWEKPFILSSATPKGALYEIITTKYKFERIDEHGSESGDEHTLVRGETIVNVEPVNIQDNQGNNKISKWFKIGYKVPRIVTEKIKEIKNIIYKNGRVFIVVDRVNQVPGIVNVLTSNGITPECNVSIKPSGCSDSEELVLVGSESISQGIDRINVRYGIIATYNWAKLIQRFGRIGRKVDSKIIIVAPQFDSGVPLQELDGLNISYKQFVEIVAKDYTDFEVGTILEKSGKYKDVMENRSTLLEYVSTIAYAHISKPGATLETLSKHAKNEGNKLINMFYGPPETITRILTFRKSGFPITVEKPDGTIEETDIATVLRNYAVKSAYKTLATKNGFEKWSVQLSISLEPARLKLVLERDPSRQKNIRPDIAKALMGKITTVGTLLDLGYTLSIRAWDNTKYKIEIPITQDVREQTIIIPKLSDELVSAHAYMVNGIEIIVGEKALIGLFV